MKRLFIILLILMISVSLFACGSEPKATGSGAVNNASAPAGNPPAANQGAGYVVDQVFFRTFQGTDGEHFQGSLRVTNTGNEPLFLFNATWDLKDSSGRLITISPQSGKPETYLAVQPSTMAYPQVINAGETGWYYINTLVEKMTDGSGDIAQAEPKYRISDPPVKYEFRQYLVSNLNLQETDGKLTATGIVEDNSGEGSGYILIYVLLYDRDGHLIGKLDSWVPSLAPGEKQSFTAEYDTSWGTGELALEMADIASCDATAFYFTQKQG